MYECSCPHTFGSGFTENINENGKYDLKMVITLVSPGV